MSGVGNGGEMDVLFIKNESIERIIKVFAPQTAGE